MYSRQEASQLRQEFWTAFGRYMQPVSSAEGEKVNWINYKTGVKDIYFRMHAGKGAYIAIELTHADLALQQDYWNRFVALESMFTNTVNEAWQWQHQIQNEHGKTISRIGIELPGVNIFNRADWPLLISFFKPRIIALDVFWNQVKHVFEGW